MDYFSEIPEGQAIVMTRGVYRQVKLYERGGKVYARHGSGLVKFSPSGQGVMISSDDRPEFTIMNVLRDVRTEIPEAA